MAREWIAGVPHVCQPFGKRGLSPEDQKFLSGSTITTIPILLSGLDNIAKAVKQEKSAFNIVKFVEGLTLPLMVTGFALLIALAWKHF